MVAIEAKGKAVLKPIDIKEPKPGEVLLETEYSVVSAGTERANLLRAMNLDRFSTVLELGAGCGAMTRYLGELHAQVDAVEGSRQRAELCRLRCRDLAKVRVINTNFNDLSLPQAAYGAVFFIGVLEYAHRFCKGTANAWQATLQIINNGLDALQPDGLLVIAIENRMGLKYWLGATEDHYARPHLGLYDYPGTIKTRTFDRVQWDRMIQSLPGIKVRYAYPFPDYKLTRAVLSDRFIRNDEYAHQVLYRLRSRDYLSTWLPDQDEFLHWRALQGSGYLADFANSFLILLSRSSEVLEWALENDFTYFSDQRRKPEYRCITFKRNGDKGITKSNLTQHRGTVNNELVVHKPTGDIYQRGPLLAVRWLDFLSSGVDNDRFLRSVKRYHAYLERQCQDPENRGYLYDLVPFNIIYRDSDYSVIDREWRAHDRVEADFILFRSLLWFAHAHECIIASNFSKETVHSIYDFIVYVFNHLGIDLENRVAQLIGQEERIQQDISYQIGPNPLEKLLYQPLQYYALSLSPETFTATVHWAEKDGDFDKDRGVAVEVPIGRQCQKLFFTLPMTPRPIRRLHFFPSGREGYFHVYRLKIISKQLYKKAEKTLIDYKTALEIAEHCELYRILFSQSQNGNNFVATDNAALFAIGLDHIPEAELEGQLQVEVEMDWPKSADHLVAIKAYRKTEARLREVEYKLNTIKSSKLWRVIDFIRKALYRGPR